MERADRIKSIMKELFADMELETKKRLEAMSDDELLAFHENLKAQLRGPAPDAPGGGGDKEEAAATGKSKAPAAAPSAPSEQRW